MCFYNKGRVRQVRIDELNVMNVMQRDVSDLEGDDGTVKIVMGDYFNDNFGQQFILVSNQQKFYYSDLKHTEERLILAEVFILVSFFKNTKDFNN